MNYEKTKLKINKLRDNLLLFNYNDIIVFDDLNLAFRGQFDVLINYFRKKLTIYEANYSIVFKDYHYHLEVEQPNFSRIKFNLEKFLNLKNSKLEELLYDASDKLNSLNLQLKENQDVCAMITVTEWLDGLSIGNQDLELTELRRRIMIDKLDCDFKSSVKIFDDYFNDKNIKVRMITR